MKKIYGIIIGVVVAVIAAVSVYFIFFDKEETNVNMLDINIVVFDKEGNEIYNEQIETDEKYLIDVLNDTEDLKVVSEDSDYGAFITSILDIEQGDNYYWSYYINDEYATVGVSSCEVEDEKTYSFKIEKFE